MVVQNFLVKARETFTFESVTPFFLIHEVYFVELHLEIIILKKAPRS